MKKTFLLVTVFILGLYAVSSQDTNAKQTISYTDFLKIVEEKLPQLEVNDLNQKLTENNVFKALAQHDVTFSSSASGFTTKYYWDSNDDRGTDYSAGFSASGDFTTTLPSGTMVTLGGGYTFQHTRTINQSLSTATMSLVDRNYASTLQIPSVNVKLNQPLIYNYFGHLNRIEKKDAKQKAAIGKLNKIELDKHALAYYRTVYFNAIQIQRTLVNLRRNIINSQRLEEQTLAKLRSGLAENDDLQRVRSSVFAYRDQYAQLEDQYNLMINELKFFIDFDTFTLDNPPFDLQVSESMAFEFKKITYDQTRQAKIAALERENMELQKKAAMNRALPSLDLFGNLTVNFNLPHNEEETSNGGTNYTKPTYKTVEFTGGLNFRYAIGDHMNRGIIKDTELSLKLLDTTFSNNEKEFNKNMDNFVTQVENIKRRITIKEQMIRSLQSQYQTELAKYSQARVELRDLLTTNSDIFNQQNELLQLKLQLIIFNYNYKDLVQ